MPFFERNQAGVPGSVHGACWLLESRTLFLLLAAAYPDGEENGTGLFFAQATVSSLIGCHRQYVKLRHNHSAGP